MLCYAAVFPYRPTWLGAAEMGCAMLIGALGLVLAARLRPLRAAAVLLTACLVWSGGAIAAVPSLALLVDPVGPVTDCAACFRCRSVGEVHAG